MASFLIIMNALFLALTVVNGDTDNNVHRLRRSEPAVPCTQGYWGENCTKQCGWCRGNGPCDRPTGNCFQGCMPNWSGPKCLRNYDDGGLPAVRTTAMDIISRIKFLYGIISKNCPAGTWGAWCRKRCGMCAGPKCEKDSGYCPSGRCKEGYTGDLCRYRIFKDPAGNDIQPFCNVRCFECDANRRCIGTPRCKAGYYGDQCERRCPDDQWGVDCRRFCPSKCDNPPTITEMYPKQMRACDLETGYCMSGCVWFQYSHLNKGSDDMRFRKNFYFTMLGSLFNVRCWCNGNTYSEILLDNNPDQLYGGMNTGSYKEMMEEPLFNKDCNSPDF